MLINTPYRDGIAIPLTIAAGVTIAEGELVAVDADGNAVPATDAGAKNLMGRAELSVSPELPAPNNAVIVTRNRQFLLANDASTPVTAADIGSPVVLRAQNTVGKFTTGDAAALGVGVLMGVDYNGQVWVEVGGAPLGMLGNEL
ncbi:hypothetical protein [Psychrobacter fulvigenes]|uniref:hypothetical protein n=1 Tax=Psychrobacter fulvigenes TaxID=533323 RepID=UPI00191821F9|nr:hypothetical protein [Psychrobacter fulvigenes]